MFVVAFHGVPAERETRPSISGITYIVGAFFFLAATENAIKWVDALVKQIGRTPNQLGSNEAPPVSIDLAHTKANQQERKVSLTITFVPVRPRDTTRTQISSQRHSEIKSAAARKGATN